jgi:hypothetical protein
MRGRPQYNTPHVQVERMNNESVRHRPRESPLPGEILVRAFARVDQMALGLAIGVVAGLCVFAATAILLLKGGDPLGPNLALLSQYIPGYAVTWAGSLVGAAAGFMIGFAVGWTIALLRNLTLSVYIYACSFWVRLNRFFDDV